MATLKTKEIIDYRGMRVFLEFGWKAEGGAFFLLWVRCGQSALEEGSV
jgi:hypothetical protein